jgi:hypothetical protein
MEPDTPTYILVQYQVHIETCYRWVPEERGNNRILDQIHYQLGSNGSIIASQKGTYHMYRTTDARQAPAQTHS